MNDIDYTLIERYLSQELSLSERTQIEMRAQNDPDFGRELSAYKMALESIKLSQREQLKNRFRNRDLMLDNEAENKRPGKNMRFMLFAIAALFIALIALQFLIRQDRPVNQAEITPIDSIRVDQPNEIKIDTTKVNMAAKRTGKSENAKPKNSIINKDSGDELYAANFEPYRDDALDPTSRNSVEDMTDYEKFEYYYWEQDYQNAVLVFRRLEDSFKQNINLKFLYGNALMASNNLIEAENLLKEVAENKKSNYAGEASYYLGLINIQKENFDLAKEYLEAYMLTAETKQTKKAKLLLEELEKL